MKKFKIYPTGIDHFQLFYKSGWFTWKKVYTDGSKLYNNNVGGNYRLAISLNKSFLIQLTRNYLSAKNVELNNNKTHQDKVLDHRIKNPPFRVR